MKLSLGIDTGGTYTDAVLFDEERGVIAKAKARTTRHDLAIGIANAVDAVVVAAASTAADIGLVSLSTTLATNALVEGRGGRVALVFIGFDAAGAERAGLTEALQGDPVVAIAGGHDPHGDQVAPLDIAALERGAIAVADSVTGFAVTSYFATRNPAHELAARDALIRLTGLPVTCSHELSAKLDGPRRALTSVLNARLIGLISELITAAQKIIASHAIDAPLMVVRGDGALMSAAVATIRPIETILSGPAASVVGATYLTGMEDAFVSDIGGTTTDVAVVRAGFPNLDESGATVGGFRTMVEAVAITTVGLGGDSEVIVSTRGVEPSITIGPRRVIPLCAFATEHAELVHRVLDAQLLADPPDDLDGRFVVPVADSSASAIGLDEREAELLRRAAHGPIAAASLVRGRGDVARLARLVNRGLVMISSFTPTDASHVLGDFTPFDRLAAVKGAQLLARRRTSVGKPAAVSAEAVSTWVVDVLRRRSAETVLDVALGIDGFTAAVNSRHPLLAASLDGRHGVAEVAARLTLPLVGLGASASMYYPDVAALLRTRAVIPADADVANAIGAVVGRVRVHTDVYISQPLRGRYRVHHRDAPGDFDDVEAAVATAESIADADARVAASAAGAADVHVTLARRLEVAEMEGERYFVEGTVTATASGRPRMGRA
ncbi:MAG TPA: hydantoinase/oxoprolinase family protein [Ilumatobacteraceae bacterium]